MSALKDVQGSLNVIRQLSADENSSKPHYIGFRCNSIFTMPLRLTANRYFPRIKNKKSCSFAHKTQIKTCVLRGQLSAEG